MHNEVNGCDKIERRKEEVKEVELEEQKKGKRTEIIGNIRVIRVIRGRVRSENLLQLAVILNQAEIQIVSRWAHLQNHCSVPKWLRAKAEE